jgi:hypothetical protein
MKSIKRGMALFAAVICVAMLIGSHTAFGQEMSNYELTEKIKALSDRLTISGAVEVEVGFENGYENESTSDITLSTVELGLEAKVCDWAVANVVLLWEEDDTEQVEVDEGTITLGNIDKYPFYLTVGKFVLPFGNYETNMISDPLTLEIGETPQSAVQLGLESSNFYGSMYVFNGDIDKGGEDDKIKSFGANAGYTFKAENFCLDIGAGWINNIADSDGLGGWIEESGLSLKDYTGGLTGHIIVNVEQFMVIAEYVTAMDDIKFTNNTTLQSPSAYNIELGYTFEMAGKETTLGIGHQGTKECGGILPESRLVASIGVSLGEYVGVALEYAHDKDYDVTKGGAGDEAEIVTVQLALEF